MKNKKIQNNIRTNSFYRNQLHSLYYPFDGMGIPKPISYTPLSLYPFWYQKVFFSKVLSLIYIVNCLFIPVCVSFEISKQEKGLDWATLFWLWVFAALIYIFHHIIGIRRAIIWIFSVLDSLIVVREIKRLIEGAGIYSFKNDSTLLVPCLTGSAILIFSFIAIKITNRSIFKFYISNDYRLEKYALLGRIENGLYNGKTPLVNESYHNLDTFCKYIKDQCDMCRVKFENERWIYAYEYASESSNEKACQV